MPDETIYGLSEGDRNTLEDALYQLKQLQSIVNTPNRSIRRDDDPPAPEVYVALTPPDGIPATSAGTGPITPGSAECDIYKQIEYETGAELQPIGEDVFKVVNNLSTSDIPGDIFIPIARDKGGDWYALGVGSGSTPTGPFQVIQIWILATIPSTTVLSGVRTYLPMTNYGSSLAQIYTAGGSDKGQYGDAPLGSNYLLIAPGAPPLPIGATLGTPIIGGVWTKWDSTATGKITLEMPIGPATFSSPPTFAPGDTRLSTGNDQQCITATYLGQLGFYVAATQTSGISRTISGYAWIEGFAIIGGSGAQVTYVIPLQVKYNSVSNVGSTETRLYDLIQPLAGSLTGLMLGDGNKIAVQYWGQFASNGNNKRIRVYFSDLTTNTVIYDSGIVAVNGGAFFINGYVIVSGPSSVRAFMAVSSSTSPQLPPFQSTDITGLHLGISFESEIQLTGQGVSSGDITALGDSIRYEIFP